VFEGLMWAFVLLAAGLGLVVLELFIPSGGLLGVLAAAAFLASMFVAIKYGSSTGGATFVVSEIVGISAVIWLAIKWWPHSALGKKIAPELPTDKDVLPDNVHTQSLRQLVGKLGQTRCQMLPSGAIAVEGQIVNAISEGMAIEAGVAVRVIEVRGNRVVVRPIALEKPAGDRAKRSADDLLSKPIEELGLEPFDNRST
jgi:membrane-bound ClpP family serine protease